MDITEFEALTPDRVDAVGSPANGIGFLMLKSVGGANPQEPEAQGESAGAGEGGGDSDSGGDSTKATAEKFIEAYCGDEECDVCKARLEVLSDEDVIKAKLSMEDRKNIPKGTFAVPSKAPGSGSYPIKDKSHARNALARASGKPVEAQVRAAVHRKYPTIGDDDDDKEKSEKAIQAQLDALREATMSAAKDTAPNKSVPRGEAESQTHEIDDCDMAPGPGGAQEGGTPSRPGATTSSQSRTTGGGDTAPNKSVPKGDALSQTNAVNKAASELISAAKAVFGLGANEKTTARAVADLTRSLTQGGLLQPAPDKEITEMTKDELFNLLDERDKARRQAKKAEAKKAQKKADKKAAKQAAKEEAAKAAGEETPAPAEADPAVKGALEGLQAQLAAVQALVSKPAMPYLNGASVATDRGQTATSEDAFKGLRDRIAAENTDRKRAVLANELLTAQAVVAERNRTANGARPGAGGPPVQVVIPG